MNHYKLRVTSQIATKQSIRQFLENNSSQYLFCQEVSTTGVRHYHAYFSTIIKNATLRLRLRKQFGTGNKSYSLTKTDPLPIEYLAYVTKDGDWEQSGINAEILIEAQLYDENVKSQMKAKKHKKKTILETLEEHCRKALELCPQHLDIGDNRKLLIGETILRYYLDNKLLINSFRIKALIETITLRIEPSYLYEYLRYILQ